MTKRNAAERQAQILELLSNNGTMKAVELADHFHVSRETIRRDLIALNNAGTAKKWFGGVLPVHDFKISSVDSRLAERQEQKIQICKKALEFIPDRAILYIDTGSTALCMARLLRARSGYTVISCSLPVINELADSKNHVIATGGSVNSQTMSMTGMQTIEFLDSIKMDLAILGSSGFDRHKGPTTNDFDDGQIKKMAVRNACASIVIADSQKASYSSLKQYAGWHEIDHLITDSEFSEDTLHMLNEQTHVVVA